MQSFEVNLQTSTEDITVNLQTDVEVITSDGPSGGFGSSGPDPPDATSVGPFPPVGDATPWTYGDDTLFIYLDDVGIDLMGAITQYKTFCNTHLGIPTGVNWPAMPNLQAIANEGVVFLDAYNTDSCSPGRACWQTGRYGHRHGTTGIVNEHAAMGHAMYPWGSDGWMEFGINAHTGSPNEYTLARLLGDKGIRNACVGKWHLGVPNGEIPQEIVHDHLKARWYELCPVSGLERGRIPWERNVHDLFNVVEDHPYHGVGYTQPLRLGWEIFRGVHSNLERNPTDDLSVPFGPGTCSLCNDEGPTDEAAASGMKPGYYNYLWYESDDPAAVLGKVEQVVAAEAEGAAGKYITTYARRRIEDLVESMVSPWFINWNLHAAHTPYGYLPNNGASYSGMLAPSSQINTAPDPYRTGDDNDAKVWDSWRSSMESVDWNIGQLRANLGEKRWANTNVIFMADNGSPNSVLSAAVGDGEDFGDYNTQVIATGKGKMSIYEAAVRVPLIVSGPLVSGTPGRVTRERVHITDIFQTLLDAFQVSREPARTGLQGANNFGQPVKHDSHSLLPVLAADAGVTTRTHVFHKKLKANGAFSGVNSYQYTPSTGLYSDGDWAEWMVRDVGAYVASERFVDGGDATATGDTIEYSTARTIAAARQGTWKVIMKWVFVTSFFDSYPEYHLYHLYDADGDYVDAREATNLYSAAIAADADPGTDELRDRQAIYNLLRYRGSTGPSASDTTYAPGILEMVYNTESRFGWDEGTDT